MAFNHLLLRITCRSHDFVLIGRRMHRSHTPKDVVHQLENAGARILRIAEKRVGERLKLLRQIADSGNSSDDIVSSRKIKELEPIHNAWNEWTRTKQLVGETLPILNDPDPAMRSLASTEYDSLISTLSDHITTVFPALLVPQSTTMHLSAMIELKSGVGGSEASLFLSDILRMYLRYSSSAGWKGHIISGNDVENGRTKGAILEIKGAGSYDALRWESGVHRVQRVPATEASGRVHTSTVAVVVLPLSEDESPTGQDALLSLDDVTIEVMRSRGAGGQHVNKTESAVRLTHKPTGITVSMQDERSQHQNKRRAFQILRARLMDAKLTKEMMERRSVRRNLVKSADRSEKIRTYNYAQDRVTDHRIGLTLMNLTSIMEGNGLQGIIDALRRNHEETLMEALLEES